MNVTQRWLAAAVACMLLVGASCGKMHYRRSMTSQQTIPVSKGGWRPVIGSNSLLSFGSFGTAPLHASPYKLQPTYDLYQSSSRPVAIRDAAKLTSIAQSYHPTTLKTVPSPSSAPANQPISSYHNPFTLTNQGQSYYKFIQNFPAENFIIRNPHNPYAARPQKIQTTKYKQPYSNAMIQQIANAQPIQFGQYPTLKPTEYLSNPYDFFGKPIATKKPQSAETEIYKPEVYKVPSDTETAPQSVNQQIQQIYQTQPAHKVQTAQQQNSAYASPKPTLNTNPFNQYPFQSALFPSNLLGSYGLQPIVGKNPVYQARPYSPFQPTRQTLFNSYNFGPTFKNTPTFFIPSSTPKQQTPATQTAVVANNHQTPTEPTKTATTPAKIDPNAGTKNTFKASPQDPFNKLYNKQVYSVSTYKPPTPSTLNNNIFKEYNLYHSNKPNTLTETYYQQQTHANNQNKNNKIIAQHDSVAAGISHQDSINAPPTLDSTPNSVNNHNTYEVTENNADIITHASPQLWSESSDQKVTEESVTKHENLDSVISKPITPQSDLPDEVAIVTEENLLTYDDQESQNRRPLGDGIEPIEKHKLKDYYYRVSTPAYEKKVRRTKKPSESSSHSSRYEATTYGGTKANDSPADALPTLPPNKHFKRPSSTAAPEPTQDKDKVRKRTKLRRRRPQLANINRNKTDSSAENNGKTGRPTLTTPTVTTEYTTSALPTLSPTNPTIIKKKLVHRRPAAAVTTPAERIETTTHIVSSSFEPIKESPIMKIASRQQYPRITPTIYEIRTEVPDYTHKQDEKDTPTSDIAVNLSDTLKTTVEAPKEFSFHRDVKPVDQTTSRATNEALPETTDDTTTIRADTSSDTSSKISRPRLKNKYNRPRFSVKDYRNRLSSTTSTTEKPEVVNAPKIRFPQRRLPFNDNSFNTDVETTTERRKFMPKDPRHRSNKTDDSEAETVTQTTRQYSSRQRPTTSENIDVTTQKMSSRIRAAHRRRPAEETTETSSPTTMNKRPLRKKIKDSDIGESVQDISVTETTLHYDKNDITSERTRSESAIMKIADKKHQEHHVEHLLEHSKRVSDLTLAASKDYNTPGMFKSVSTNSRRIPNYFTIATDDPILPIEAFFPQLNQKKET